MILYTDTSALVKRYVREEGTEDVASLFEQHSQVAASVLTQAEMASALAKAVRMAWVNEQEGDQAWQDFLSHWPGFLRLPLSSGMIERAAALAWEHGLRADDAIHLACALALGEMSGEPVRFACYDHRLQEAARKDGLQTWPGLG